jgi:hypothetical protein
VKLSGFTFEYKVQEFCDALSGSSGSFADEDAVLSLDASYPPYSGRSGKKADVHRFGIVMLALKIGRIVTATHPALPKDLSADFRSFVEK